MCIFHKCKFLVEKIPPAVAIFVIILLFSCWSYPDFGLRIYPDSWGYINVAKDFSDPSHEIRPFFYPLIIKISMVISPIYWESILLIIQISFHSIIIIFLYNLFLKFKISKYVAFTLSMIIGLNPNQIYWSASILSDQMLGVLICMTWISLISLIMTKPEHGLLNNKFLYLTGILSGLALVTKPVWLLGILPIIFTLIIFETSRKSLFISIVILLSLHFSFNIIWGLYKYKIGNKPKFGVTEYSNVIEKLILFNSGRNINRGAIRMGMIDYAEGTSLYKIIESKGLLDMARELDGENEAFLLFKDSVSVSMHNWGDAEFARSILRNAPAKYYFGLLKNWHTFFIKRMFHYPIETLFPKAPRLLSLIYVKFYNFLYRPLLSSLLLFFIFITVYKNQTNLNIIISSSLPIIFYFTMMHTLILGSNYEFIRLRTSIEYILFFCALMPIGILSDKIIKRIKTF